MVPNDVHHRRIREVDQLVLQAVGLAHLLDEEVARIEYLAISSGDKVRNHIGLLRERTRHFKNDLLTFEDEMSKADDEKDLVPGIYDFVYKKYLKLIESMAGTKIPPRDSKIPASG